MSTIIPSPAARAALAEATRRWPHRNRVQDGIVGDERHQAGTSFHNAYLVGKTGAEEYGIVPAAKGMALAFDLTHDPANGCDSQAVAQALVAMRHPAVVQAITFRRIWSRKRAAEGWRPYHGADAHDRHCHVSIDPHHFDYAGEWFEFAGGAADGHAAGDTQAPSAVPRVRLTHPMMRGPHIAELQRALRVAPADGVWGPTSDRALRVFQASHQLSVDGIAGPATLAALAAEHEATA